MSLPFRSWRKTSLGAAAAFLASSATQALALPFNYELGFQPSDSTVMDQIENFHIELLYIITAVCLFVLALLLYISFKFRAAANPTPCGPRARQPDGGGDVPEIVRRYAANAAL